MIHRVILFTAFVLLGSALAEPQGAQARPHVWNFTKIAPTEGPWGTKVRLHGYGFTKNAKVYYAGQLVRPLRVQANLILVQVPEKSRSGWFEIAIGNRQLRAPEIFRVKNEPVLTGIEPESGPAGIWVTIKGKHFHKNIRFWIGRTPVRRNHVSSSVYKVLIHKGLGSGWIYWDHDGRRRRTKHRFKIASFPVLQGFSPKKGYFGDRVTLEGVSICPRAKVFLNGTPLEVVRRKGSTAIVVRLPKGVATGRFEVSCFGKRTTLAEELQVEPPYAEVTGISPAAGKSGRWILVIGMGFRPKDRFWMGNRPLRRKLISATRVKVYVPKGIRSAALYFESFGRRFKSSFTYEIYRPPVVSGFSPGSAWHGQQIEVRGRHFCPMAKVSLRGRDVPVIRRKGSSLLVVEVPSGARTGRVAVKCLKWTARSSAQLKIERPKSGVTSVSPEQAPPGSRVEIKGFNLRASDRFYLGKVRLPMAFDSERMVTVTIPPGASSGALIHESFGKRVQTRHRIQVGWPKPVMEGFEPQAAWYGDVVTLKGKQLCDGPVVRLGGRVVPVVNASGSRIQVKIPRRARGGAFSVQCHNHRVKVPGSLEIQAPYAKITSIYPKRGPWSTWITLTGKNFRKGDRFLIGRKPVTDVRQVSTNEVRIKVPRGASTGKVVVHSRGRRVVTEHTFTLDFPAAQVTGIEPKSGWWGDLVTIKGRHFCPKPVVRFGRRTATDVVRESERVIKARVPKRAGTAGVEVRCYAKPGRGSARFRVKKPEPRIVDVYPDRGPPKRWISITGHNLDRLDRAWLNHRKYGRVELTIKKISDTRLKALIPAGAKGGAIEIEAFGTRRTTSFSYIVPRKYR